MTDYEQLKQYLITHKYSFECDFIPGRIGRVYDFYIPALNTIVHFTTKNVALKGTINGRPYNLVGITHYSHLAAFGI